MKDAFAKRGRGEPWQTYGGKVRQGNPGNGLIVFTVVCYTSRCCYPMFAMKNLRKSRPFHLDLSQNRRSHGMHDGSISGRGAATKEVRRWCIFEYPV